MLEDDPKIKSLETTIQRIKEENYATFHFAPNFEKINALMKLYEQVTLFENTILLLYDHKNMEFKYVSENIWDKSGYTAEEMKDMGAQFYFKFFDPNHYDFPFHQVEIEKSIYPTLEFQNALLRRYYVGGLKARHKDGTELRFFCKIKPLISNEYNLPELSIVQAEVVNHFFKGPGYWIRIVQEDFTYCFVSHLNKHEYKDLLSPREKEILALIAENKSTKEIATLLHLSTGTIDSHRRNMIARTGAVNSTALVHLCKLSNIL